ncbi:reticulophagy regulator 1-like, partial [Megalops cyprinoides]|uniref:reticulophagy regulator 1-like n=1 Tax=Megalops cyprinoides TaxID=118141 RepID=UPI001863F3BD
PHPTPPYNQPLPGSLWFQFFVDELLTCAQHVCANIFPCCCTAPTPTHSSAVLGIFLWPLMSSHQLGLWVKPVLQKLDFGVGSFLHKMRENREKRMLQKQENSEIDISALCPKMDSTIFKELSVSDTEASEVTWTDGTFNLSEGHTPQTENSEDLDRRSDQEEFFTEGLPEFPNMDNGTNGEDDELSIGLPTPLPMLDMAGALVEGRALELVNQMAGDVIAGGLTAAIQEQLRACAPQPAPEPLDFAEDSDSEGEEFELLDQSELENVESNLGQEARAKAKKPSGFLSNLLRRH